MSPRTASILRWSALALLGLVVAVAVGVAAANLTSSRIGISNEPVRAGEALAPKTAKQGDRHGGRGRDHREDGRHHGGGPDDATTTTTTPTTTIPPTTTPTTVPPTTTVPPPTATTTPTTPSDDSGHSEDGDDD